MGFGVRESARGRTRLGVREEIRTKELLAVGL